MYLGETLTVYWAKTILLILKRWVEEITNFESERSTLKNQFPFFEFLTSPLRSEKEQQVLNQRAYHF